MVFERESGGPGRVGTIHLMKGVFRQTYIRNGIFETPYQVLSPATLRSQPDLDLSVSDLASATRSAACSLASATSSVTAV